MSTIEYPLVITPSLSILDLGIVDKVRPAFRNARHVYPIGFKSQRVYNSYINKNTTTKYTSEIREFDNQPLFVVTAADDPDVEHGSFSPSACWVEVIRLVRGSGTASGPEYFGFADKKVRQLIDSGVVIVDKKRKIDHVDSTQPESPVKEGPESPPAPKKRRTSIEKQPEQEDTSDNSDDDEASDNEQDEEIDDDMEEQEEIESDHPDLPLQISNGITLINLGRVEHERSAFHSKLYIYTIGFKSQKRHFSYINPSEYTTYTSTVRDNGDAPLFVVTVEDDPGVEYIALSPTTCWMEPAGKVNKLRGTKTAISGPHFFGFTDLIAKALIESLPGASQCSNYNRKGAATGKHGISAKMGIKLSTSAPRHRRIGLVVPIERNQDKIVEPVTEDMAALRTMYELPYVFYMSTILRKKLGLPCFTCRQLERLIITPTKVTCRLYLTMANEEDQDQDDWQTSTEWIPESVEWTGSDQFENMDVSTRLKLLYGLLEWRMYSNREIMVHLRKLDENVTRIDPIGSDSEDNKYYHFGDERIYREDTEKRWSLVAADSLSEIAKLAEALEDESEAVLKDILKDIARV
jgi:hypothetical protein